HRDERNTSPPTAERSAASFRPRSPRAFPPAALPPAAAMFAEMMPRREIREAPATHLQPVPPTSLRFCLRNAALLQESPARAIRAARATRDEESPPPTFCRATASNRSAPQGGGPPKPAIAAAASLLGPACGSSTAKDCWAIVREVAASVHFPWDSPHRRLRF